MNEWLVSTLVTIGGVSLIVFILWLKENHREILIGAICVIVGIAILIGLINIVHDFIYNLLPTLRGAS